MLLPFVFVFRNRKQFPESKRAHQVLSEVLPATHASKIPQKGTEINGCWSTR